MRERERNNVGTPSSSGSGYQTQRRNPVRRRYRYTKKEKGITMEPHLHQVLDIRLRERILKEGDIYRE